MALGSGRKRREEKRREERSSELKRRDLLRCSDSSSIVVDLLVRKDSQKVQQIFSALQSSDKVLYGGQCLLAQLQVDPSCERLVLKLLCGALLLLSHLRNCSHLISVKYVTDGIRVEGEMHLESFTRS